MTARLPRPGDFAPPAPASPSSLSVADPCTPPDSLARGGPDAPLRSLALAGLRPAPAGTPAARWLLRAFLVVLIASWCSALTRPMPAAGPHFGTGAPRASGKKPLSKN